MSTFISLTLHGACVLTALASAGLWLRSHCVVDRYMWPVRSGAGFMRVVSRSVETSPGRLVFREHTALM